MKRTKFQYKTFRKTIIEIDWAELKLAMAEHENGEVLVREQMEWNVEQMRKYLHGPATKFFIAMFKQHNGIVFTTPEMHRWLRDAFLDGKWKKVGSKTVYCPISSESLGRKGYHKWIKDMNEYCMDAWQCELPPAEQVE